MPSKLEPKRAPVAVVIHAMRPAGMTDAEIEALFEGLFRRQWASRSLSDGKADRAVAFCDKASVGAIRPLKMDV